MRKNVVKFCAAVVVPWLLLASPGLAEDSQIPHVSVVGISLVEVVPDVMHWSLAVTSKGKEVVAVAADHDARVGRVIAFLKDKGIAEKQMQTSSIQLSENWIYKRSTRVKEGYIATTAIQFEGASLDGYRELWSGLAAQEFVTVRNVHFDTSERIKHQNVSRLKAVAAAKEKAMALAGALGVTVAEPIVIEEVASYNPDVRSTTLMEGRALGMAAPHGDGGGASVAPGRISIRTQVKVKFRIYSEG